MWTSLSLIIQVLSQIVQIVDGTVCYDDVGCFQPITTLVPNSPTTVGTQFLLYTRSTNNNNSTILDYSQMPTLQQFDSKKKTFVIAHGWESDAFDTRLVQLRKVLLQKFDANAIMVDWKKAAANKNYFQASIDTQLVGRQTALLLSALQHERGLNISNVHLIGMSLGAHIFGFTGKWLKATRNVTVGRISALDPAGVWFQLQKPELHLNPSDANFVDVTHTFAAQIPLIGGIGFLQPCGHVDFYPNGGRTQPKCEQPLGLNVFNCNHEAAVLYYTESVSDDCPFTSKPCPNVSDQSERLNKRCAQASCNDNCGRMGYYSDTSPGRGPQYLTTNKIFPYCIN